MDDHERYGTEKACGGCGGGTIVALSFVASPTVPERVQARCPRLQCAWRGQVRVREGDAYSPPVAAAAEQTLGI